MRRGVRWAAVQVNRRGRGGEARAGEWGRGRGGGRASGGDGGEWKGRGRGEVGVRSDGERGQTRHAAVASLGVVRSGTGRGSDRRGGLSFELRRSQRHRDEVVRQGSVHVERLLPALQGIDSIGPTAQIKPRKVQVTEDDCFAQGEGGEAHEEDKDAEESAGNAVCTRERGVRGEHQKTGDGIWWAQGE